MPAHRTLAGVHTNRHFLWTGSGGARWPSSCQNNEWLLIWVSNKFVAPLGAAAAPSESSAQVLPAFLEPSGARTACGDDVAAVGELCWGEKLLRLA